MTGKKLLFLIESLSSGGAETQLVNLLKGMVRQGEDVHLITWIDNNFYREKEIPGVHWVKLKRRNFLDFGLVLKMISYSRRNRIDLIHGYLDNGNLYTFFIKLVFPRKKCFLSERSSERNLPFFRNIYKRIIHSWPSLTTICNSKAGEIFVKKISIFPPKTQIIRNGFDLTRFSLIKREDRSKLRRQYYYGEDEFIILMVGRLIPLKRPLEVVDAFLEFNKKYPKSRLILLGDGKSSYKEILIERKHSDNLSGEKIELIPAVKKVEDYYNLASLYIHNSEREGSPNTLVEAMASGLPVVTTNVGDISFYVDEHKFEYWINDDKLSSIFFQLEKVIQLDEQERRELGQLNYERIHKKLSCDYQKMVESHSKIYGINS